MKKEANGEMARVDDVLPTMFRCRYWIAYATLALCVLLLLVWSIAGRINENVYGCGVITSGDALYNTVVAPSDGQILVLDVKPGDEIRAGQLIGRLYSNDDYAALNRQRGLADYFRWSYERNIAIVEGIKTNRADYSAAELKRLEAALARDRTQLAWWDDFLGKLPSLARSGAISQQESERARDTFNDRLRSYDKTASEMLRERYDSPYTAFSLEHDLFDYAAQDARARMEAQELLRRIDYRSRILSHCSGTVVNLNVDVGNEVRRGDEILRVIQGADAGAGVWEVVGYFSAIDAKQIEPGMSALVTPSTVDVEEDGSIVGFVTSVGQDLETAESIYNDFRSKAFAGSLMETCRSLPIKVTVLLSRNLANPSGFDWTGGRGPDLRIPHGTVSSISVATQSHSPMNILLGRVRRLTFGDGIMHSRNGMRESLRGARVFGK